MLVNVTELISTITDNFNEVNEQRRIDLRIDFPAQEVILVSDQGALEKILYNLVSNAYKYTPAGGYISIALRAEAGRTTVRVRNSGKGIKPEDIGNVFNRFEILDNFERQANEGKVMQQRHRAGAGQEPGGHVVGKYHREQQARRVYDLYAVAA